SCYTTTAVIVTISCGFHSLGSPTTRALLETRWKSLRESSGKSGRSTGQGISVRAPPTWSLAWEKSAEEIWYRLFCLVVWSKTKLKLPPPVRQKSPKSTVVAARVRCFGYGTANVIASSLTCWAPPL